MIVCICIAAIALAILCLRAGRRERPLARNDVVRLSLYSERVRREELFPFVE
jgi:hypothetical protein